jgi:ABC-type multidrug transport system fused ATPase/permease subunit
MTINKAIGEKVGMMIFSIGMTLCGLVIGIVNGWTLALAMLAIAPMIGICAIVFFTAAVTKSVKTLKAYAQSGGYAEQCLSSVKVVAAFGMEQTEIKNYSSHL